jgi:hypothetical protein
MQVSDLLQYLASNQATGTLVVTHDDVDISIYFRGGAIISSASTKPTLFLGHFLVSHGFISEEELATAMARQDISRSLLGKILVDQGSLTAPELERMLRLKAEETIYELFTWSDGEFRFNDDELPDYEMIPLAISVSKLILEGLERLYEWDKIQQLIPSLQAVPVSVCDLVEGGAELDEGDRSILAAVNDDRSIEEICLHSHASEYRVCSLLIGLVEESKLKLVRPRMVAPAASAVATSADDLATQAKTCFDDGDLESALRFAQAAASLEPDNRVIEAEVNRVKNELRQRIAAAGISAQAVPHLEVAAAQLTTMSLSPQEGFILSRINGSITVSAIVKISPMSELEANLMIWKLLKSELIRL